MPRARTTRASETRATEMRVMPATERRGKLWVDPRKIPAGWTYHWCRESTLNVPDPENIVDKQVGGWSPVPASRHPELVPPPLPGYEGTTTQVIRRGGQMLFEKRTSEVNAMRRAVSQESRDALNSVAWTGQADPTMPRMDMGSATTIEQVTASFKDD